MPDGVLRLDGSATDREVKRRIAVHFDVRREAIDRYVVDRRPTGDLVVQPEAVYG